MTVPAKFPYKYFSIINHALLDVLYVITIVKQYPVDFLILSIGGSSPDPKISQHFIIRESFTILVLMSHVTFSTYFLKNLTFVSHFSLKKNLYGFVNGERILSSFGPEKGLIHCSRTLLRVSLACLLLRLTSSVFRFNELRHSGPCTHTSHSNSDVKADRKGYC